MQTLQLFTNVEDMIQFNSSEFNASWLISWILKADDIKLRIRLNEIEYLMHESLTLHYILSQIQNYVLLTTSSEQFRKVIITEDMLLVTWFYEWVLNHLHISIKMLAAYLTAEEQKKVIDDFNNTDLSVVILIIMYAVSAQRLNLDLWCSRVLIAASAVNTAAEIQIWDHVLWVSYNFISVWRLC